MDLGINTIVSNKKSPSIARRAFFIKVMKVYIFTL